MRNKLILLGIVLVLFSSFGLAAYSTDPNDYQIYNDTTVAMPSCAQDDCYEYLTQGEPTGGEHIACEFNITFPVDGRSFTVGGTGTQSFLRPNCEDSYTPDALEYFLVSTWHEMNMECNFSTTYYYKLNATVYGTSADTVSLAYWSNGDSDWIYTDEDFHFGELNNGFDDGFVGLAMYDGGDPDVSITQRFCYNGTTRPIIAPPAPTIASLNISNPAPPNYSSFNVQTVNFNLTANASYVFNASLYINDVLNQTTDNWSAGENTLVNFDVSFDDDGAYTYQIRCDDGLIHANTSIVDFFMDFEVPTIQTNFVNYSIFFINNLTTQFNFSDNLLLHSINISIDDKLILDEEHVHNTTYQYNLSWDLYNYSVGVHNITIGVADGHTAFELKESYDWTNGLFNDYMKYTFSNGGFIKTELKESSIFDSWSTKKLFDRYTQTLTPNTPSDTITLVEESNQKIHIANKPGKYKGQWIITGDKWKDYVLKDEPNSKVSIKRINNYKVEVTISGIKNTEQLEFESIGDLNVVTQVFPFVVVNSSESYTSPILETQTQTMTLILNKTIGVTTNADLFYDGVEQTVTKTPFSVYDFYSSTFNAKTITAIQENVTFYWQYDFFGSGNNESGNLTFNQTVNAMRFDNCSSFSTVAVNFTIKNETSGSAVDTNSTIEGYFKVWKSSESEFSEFNLTWGPPNANGVHGLCIDPPGDNFTMNAQLEYGADNFPDKKLYYFNDYFIDNATDQIDLFLTDGTTSVTLTVKDFDDSVVEGAVIKVLSYDLVTDTSTTTEIVETDTNGEAVVQLILNTQFYVFIVEVDGVIKLQTSPTKISTTTKTLRIDLSDIRYFDRYDTTRGITHSLVNASNKITFTWSDPSGEVADACLKVSRTTVNQQGTLSDRCLSSTAGTITYYINETTDNNTYRATSYVKFSDATTHVLKTINLNFDLDAAYKKFGLTGIFVAFLLTLTLIGVGIWHPVIAVLLGILGITVASIIGIFNVGPAALIGLIILGGIILYKLTKN